MQPSTASAPIELDLVIVDTKARRVRRARWAAFVTSSGFVALLFDGCAARGGLNDLAAWGAVGAVVSGVLGLVSVRLSRTLRATRVTRSGALTITPSTIVLARSDERPVVVPRRTLTSGWLEPGGFVRIVQRGGTEIALQPRLLDRDARAAGEALLEQLGLGASQRSATFTVGPRAPWLAGLAGLVNVAAVICTATGIGFVANAIDVGRFEGRAITWCVVALAALAAALTGEWLTSRRSIRVGTDGVRVLGLGGRFVPTGRIARVEEQPGGVVLHLVDGDRVTLPHDTERDELDRRSHVARLAQVLGARARASSELTGAALDPGERSIEAWRAHLRALVSTDGEYRKRRLEPEEVERVLADGAAPPPRRIGAALALGALGQEGARERIRLAASASSDDALREALERAAEGEVEEASLRRLTTRR